MTTIPISCDIFVERLADFLDGSIESGESTRLSAHVASCADCTALVADLQTISNSAAALPSLSPSHDLWVGIAARIETPVTTIGDRPARVRASDIPRTRLIAAAAALVVVTAGLTSWTTQRIVAGRAAESLAIGSGQDTASDAAPARITGNGTPLGGSPGTPIDPLSPGGQRPLFPNGPARVAAAVNAPDRGNSPRATSIRDGSGPSRFARAERPAAAERSNYDREIVMLRTMLDARRAALDPATVTTIEQSLTVIDQAIAQSRDALRRDPGSSFLAEQLESALGAKVTVLRTATLLTVRN